LVAFELLGFAPSNNILPDQILIKAVLKPSRSKVTHRGVSVMSCTYHRIFF
jgi:hypothetical protein